jgi:hypothetical protein
MDKIAKVAHNIRNTTADFATALIEAGVKIKRAQKVKRGANMCDMILVRGRQRFNADLAFDYERGIVEVSVWSKKGMQMRGLIASFSELRALFSTWELGTI